MCPSNTRGSQFLCPLGNRDGPDIPPCTWVHFVEKSRCMTAVWILIHRQNTRRFRYLYPFGIRVAYLYAQSLEPLFMYMLFCCRSMTLNNNRKYRVLFSLQNFGIILPIAGKSNEKLDELLLITWIYFVQNY